MLQSATRTSSSRANHLLPTPPSLLLTELQSFGMRLTDTTGAASRRGGAGPSDHKAIRIAGQTIMVPIHTASSHHSAVQCVAPPGPGRYPPCCCAMEPPWTASAFRRSHGSTDCRRSTGVPYWKIAMLHGTDVLATTVLQTCIRYADRRTACQFCAIGQSLAANRTIAHKTPVQLAEVARAAVLLDGIRHMVLTTGTPNVIDRGAEILCDSTRAIKAAVDLPVQAQCEPPRDALWYARLRDAGVDSLGMHLEAATQAVRARIMPGKATVSLDRYLDAFRDAVPVFGRGQVSTYLLAGLGDTAAEILSLVRDAHRYWRASVRGTVRADHRHAARKPCAADRGVHALGAGAARPHAPRQPAAVGGRKGRAAAAAAPARPCPPTRTPPDDARNEPLPGRHPAVRAGRVSRQARQRGVGAACPLPVAPGYLLRRAGHLYRTTTMMASMRSPFRWWR